MFHHRNASSTQARMLIFGKYNSRQIEIINYLAVHIATLVSSYYFDLQTTRVVKRLCFSQTPNGNLHPC